MKGLRELLRLAGKGDRKVIAVFSDSAAAAEVAARHLRAGAPGVPLWLFTTCSGAPRQPFDRIISAADALTLFVEGQKALWPEWVALSVAAWTGTHGKWPLKLAPFLILPFRVLIQNENGGFFHASPAAVLTHVRRRTRDSAHSGWNRVKDIHRGAWLWLFAAIAQRFTPLSRAAFHRWHGNATLHLEAQDQDSPSLAFFRYGDRHWNWADLNRIVHTPGPRWILFLDGVAEACTKDLLPLFDDPRTFAVSRQMDYRDWKEGLFAAAPFRPLQPGEASQTLAPVSTAIVVDRAKLAALGIPKTIVPGSAWLKVFWMAAAAGWRSYSVGAPDAALEESPDWPYEEAEFVTRILSQPPMRALGPREPCLSRGSVAFSLSHQQPFRGLPRVLIVSPYLPYPLSHGGAVRIYSLCRALAGRVDFVLACFREKEEVTDYTKLAEIFREVYVVDRDEHAQRNGGLPRQVKEHQSRSMRALISEICRTGSIDRLQIEYTHLAAFRDAAPSVPAILVEHDLTFTLYRQLGDRAEFKRWLAFERHWLRAYDTVWTMSDGERAQAMLEGSAPDRTITVPNGVDPRRFTSQPEREGSLEVFYVGSFRHLPNILGFEKLRDEIMPRVWERFPEAMLRVVAGPEPQRYWQAFRGTPYPSQSSRVVLHEFVADLRPFYASASVVAVPLLVSAGTNIKVMEAMACGRAVVSTPIGCAGLGLRDGVDALIRKESADFASAVCDLLASRALRTRIAGEARRTAEDCFSWDAIAEEAYRCYVS